MIPETERHRDDMRAIVIVPVLKQGRSARSTQADSATPSPQRSDEARLEEAIGLARAIDLTIVQGLIVPISQAKPATLMGSGKIEEIKALLDEHDAGLVIIDHPLTPVQQRNLENGTRRSSTARASSSRSSAAVPPPRRARCRSIWRI
jgi:GTP-binding protein HflX